MYLSKLLIKGYKTFNEAFETQLNKGLTLFVGENGTGKTSIIDAIRVILNEDEYGRIGIRSSDFHRPIIKPAKEKGADSIEIKATFSELKPVEQVAILPWLDAKDNKIAYLNIKIDNKEDPRGKFKRIIWGGESISSIFEWDLINKIVCIYLPPLRDAENKLDALRGSRLSRLFRDEKPKPGDPEHDLEKEFKTFNERLSQGKTIGDANKQIKAKLKESLGQFLGQDALIQFSETSFDRIVEKLRLLFYPTISNKTSEYFREISENSMGYNNILYLATVLAELERTKDSIHKIILIEEPEAHLHPQLQIRLLQYLHKQALESDIQIIVTSHSTTITASVELDSINVLTLKENINPKSTLLKNCKIDDEQSKYFIERWLDITKSILFFAKGLILVEGISEALVIKELSKKIVKEATKNDANPRESLEDCGVSIININGINFRNFFKLFQGYKLDNSGNKIIVDFIPVKCAGITDCDPQPVDGTKPTLENPCDCGNSQSSNFVDELIDNNSQYCRIFTNLKTFEYDLAMEGNNLSVMYKIIEDGYKNECERKRKAKEYSDKDWTSVSGDKKKDVCFELLYDNIKGMKGEFGQKLAYKLSNEPDLDFSVPKYIKDAILWAIGKN